MGKLDGRIALVTGAADGLGATIAEELAREGCTVVATDINTAGLQRLVERVGHGMVALELDVRSEAAWRDVVAEVQQRFGRLDILVNNAGGSGAGTIEEVELDAFRHAMALNVDSTYIGSKLAIELMKERAGSIVNIASVHGLRAAAHAPAYTAAKGAVTMLTKAIALHCGQRGYRIRCNSVHPGYILTTQVRQWISDQANPEQVLADLRAKHPIGYLGEPIDVARGVVFLVSDDARFITGAELVIDGGFCL